MIASTLLICLAHQARSEPSSDARAVRRLKTIAHERARLESVLKERPENRRFSGIAAFFGGQGGNALYPFGVSSRRFVHAFGGEGDRLLFQSLHGKIARTDWSVEIVAAKGAPPRRGTIRRYLWGDGTMVDDRRLTREQRSHLDADVSLAGYGTIPEIDVLRVWTVRPDGTATPQRYLEPDPRNGRRPFLPVLSEESRRLGLGSKGWTGSGDYRLKATPP